MNKAQRELDRERMKLEQQEKKIIQDIKKTAKAGQMVMGAYRNLFLLAIIAIASSYATVAPRDLVTQELQALST